jgi:hypothetical protein
MNKILWCTSFRSFNKSLKNDAIQNYFISSLESIESHKIKLIVTQFAEENVEERLNKSILDYIFIKNNIQIPEGIKYSQSIIFRNAVEEYVNNNYDYLVWSTCDFIFTSGFITQILTDKNSSDQFMSCIIPQNSITEQSDFRIFSFNYGIDFFIFKINDQKKKFQMLELVKNCENYNWGAYEHFLCSMKDLLNIEASNSYRYSNIIKYENDRIVFNETRNNQISEWKLNAKNISRILKNNNVSILYIKGSMLYLFLKMTRLRDYNLNLIFKFIILIFKIILSKLK